MTDVINIFTKKKVDRRKTRSNQIRDRLNMLADMAHQGEYKSYCIVMMTADNEEITDYIIEPENMAQIALEMEALTEEVKDVARFGS